MASAESVRMVRYAMLLGATALSSAPALAQTARADEDAPTAEIVVTAQKREQALIDVPISISALNSAALEDKQINDLRDFVGQVPNLVVNNFNARSDTVRLFIRGIGQNDVSMTQDPSVALYVDGVYVGTSIGGGFETEDIERIEVLRGPQGTLYGRNATGGAVNVISMKPDLSGFSGRASYTLGNYDYSRSRLTLNAPITDWLGVRGTIVHARRDGLYENTGKGVDFALQNRTAARLAVRARFAERFTLDYAFDYSLNKDSGTLSVPTAGAAVSFPVAAPFPIPGTGGFATGITRMVNEYTGGFSPRRPKTGYAYRDFQPGRGTVYGNTITAEFEASEDLTLRSITGFRRIRNRQYSDSMPNHQASIVTSVLTSAIPQLPVGTVLNLIGPNGAASGTDVTRFNSFSEELQAVGSADLGGSALEYVVGGYFYKDRGGQTNLNPAIGSGALIIPAETSIRNRSYAAFTELTFFPAKDGPLSFTIGARYSKDKREASRINERSFSFAALGGFTADNCAFHALVFQALGQTCSPTGAVQAAEYSQSFNNFTPSLTIAYKASPDLNLFAKYVRGYKSGGTSQRSANPINFANGFKPEKVQSFEVGAKAYLLDRTVSAGITGFYITLERYQASLQTGATAGDRDFLPIDNNKIYGVEFDFSAKLNSAFTFAVNGAVLKTKFGQDSADVLLDTGQQQHVLFVDRFSMAPSVSLNSSLAYDQPITDSWRVRASGEISFQSSMATSSNIADNVTLPSRAIVDASVALVRQFSEDGPELELRLWAKNLFDEEYLAISQASFAGLGASRVSEFGEPQTVGLTASLRF